jgi:hypothetical protein
LLIPAIILSEAKDPGRFHTIYALRPFQPGRQEQCRY